MSSVASSYSRQVALNTYTASSSTNVEKTHARLGALTPKK